MQTVRALAELRAIVRGWHNAGQSVALVATMGNLHSGHLSLVEAARQHGDRVVTSIFVNPLQFGDGEDFDQYPRSLTEDVAMLSASACDLVYAPAVNTMYPRGRVQTRITVGELAVQLCGAHRAGHFEGMATVVVKLFNQVLPDIAVFGQKDYQQLAVIQQVVKDLDMSVQLRGMPTVREDDGLAKSSRNRYLTDQQRQLAPLLYRLLSGIADQLARGERDFERLQSAASEGLRDAGFQPDYVEIRSLDLSPASEKASGLVVLGAATLGKARLIDNVIVSL